MYTRTYPLSDGRQIDVSADRRGRVLRLRAHLVSGGIIEAAHRNDYRHGLAYDIEVFTREFEAIARIAAPRPLFRDL